MRVGREAGHGGGRWRGAFYGERERGYGRRDDEAETRHLGGWSVVDGGARGCGVDGRYSMWGLKLDTYLR